MGASLESITNQVSSHLLNEVPIEESKTQLQVPIGEHQTQPQAEVHAEYATKFEACKAPNHQAE